jgi:hypothetical protein
MCAEQFECADGCAEGGFASAADRRHEVMVGSQLGCGRISGIGQEKQVFAHGALAIFQEVGRARRLLLLEAVPQREGVDWQNKPVAWATKTTHGLVSVRGPRSCPGLLGECAQCRHDLAFACQSSHEREQFVAGYFYGLAHARIPSRGPNLGLQYCFLSLEQPLTQILPFFLDCSSRRPSPPRRNGLRAGTGWLEAPSGRPQLLLGAPLPCGCRGQPPAVVEMVAEKLPCT